MVEMGPVRLDLEFQVGFPAPELAEGEWDLLGLQRAHGQPGFANRFLAYLCWWSFPELTPIH